MPRSMVANIGQEKPVELVLKNKSPFLCWAFALIIYAVMVEVTWIFVRDGGFHTLAPHQEVFLFFGMWIIGICMLVMLLKQKLMKTTISDGVVNVSCTCLMPLYRDVEKFKIKEARGVYFITDQLSNGDINYRCELMTPKGALIVLKEGLVMPEVRAAYEKIFLLVHKKA